MISAKLDGIVDRVLQYDLDHSAKGYTPKQVQKNETRIDVIILVGTFGEDLTCGNYAEKIPNFEDFRSAVSHRFKLQAKSWSNSV